jgi:pyroglutamyl-peptidase
MREKPARHDPRCDPRISSRSFRATVAAPRLLVTGFGPFPGAPENPTEALVRALAVETADTFGASACRAVILPTEYGRSWAALRGLYARFRPDVVVHFGVSGKAEAIMIERLGRCRTAADVPDSAGYAPISGRARRSGPDTLAATLPVEAVLAALLAAKIPAALSDDAGAYVCNATLYRSLGAAPTGRLVGFVHVPPLGVNGFAPERLHDAAAIILRTAAAAWLDRNAPVTVSAGEPAPAASPPRPGGAG